MFLVYCDEQDDCAHKFSAAVACVIEDRLVEDFRHQLISDLRKIFGRGEDDATPFPVLHAAELPQDLTDCAKVELFSSVIHCVKKYCAAVYRVGYCWNDGQIEGLFGLNGRQQTARAAAYSTMLHELSQLKLRPLAFVQEYDKSSHEKFSEILNRTQNIEQMIQLEMLRGGGCNHLNGFLGYYYAPKRDHLLYAADFVAYLLKIQKEERPSAFKQLLIESSPDLNELVLRDQIVRQ